MAHRTALIELDEQVVTDLAIQQLRKRISEKVGAKTLFACKICGECGYAVVADRESSSFWNLTCADALEKKDCLIPETFQSENFLPKFVPGSLVLVSLGEGNEMPWPGVIEDPPSGEDVFITRGLSSDDPEQVFYYVTLIFPKNEDQRWVGGFVAASDVKPFVALKYRDAYVQSLARAKKAATDSPQQCLKKFSFVAHIASQRGIDVFELPSTSTAGLSRKRTAASRIDSDRGGVPMKRARFSTEAPKVEELGPILRRDIGATRGVSVATGETVVTVLESYDTDSE